MVQALHANRAMRLTELHPQFIRYEMHVESWTRRKADGSTEQVTGPRVYIPYVNSIAEAQGIMFLCPKCFAQNGGPVGTHMVICWSRSRGVPNSAEPGPGRWKLEGIGYSDLTLSADPPNTAHSVLLTTGCRWHGFITDGEVR